MPTADLDIWRTANLLVKQQHGEDAAIVAAQRADELLAKGDIEGEIVGTRIVGAVNELQRQTPAPGEAMN
jgi:hypothetical protein